MDTVAKGLAILRKAEAALREAASEAAAAGEYTATMKLARWGQELSRLSTSVDPAMPPEPGLLSTAVGAGGAAGSEAAVDPGGRGRRGGGREQRSKAKRRDDDYPRFFRRGDLLVKVGWSKREKAQYQHKAPRHVVDTVIEALRNSEGDQDLIAIPALLPLKASSGEEVPPYQVYLCLAWLRKLGLIEQHGRDGYTIRGPAELPGDVSAAWDALSRLRATQNGPGS